MPVQKSDVLCVRFQISRLLRSRTGQICSFAVQHDSASGDFSDRTAIRNPQNLARGVDFFQLPKYLRSTNRTNNWAPFPTIPGAFWHRLHISVFTWQKLENISTVTSSNLTWTEIHLWECVSEIWWMWVRHSWLSARKLYAQRLPRQGQGLAVDLRPQAIASQSHKTKSKQNTRPRAQKTDEQGEESDIIPKIRVAHIELSRTYSVDKI